MKRAKKRASARLGAGAKAPKLSDRVTQLEKVLAHRSTTDIERISSNLGFEGAGVASIGASSKLASPTGPPPYRSRLELIYNGLCELENAQRSHQSYLAGAPPNGPGNATTAAAPCGIDELFSAIESELTINQLMFRDLSNKF